MTSSAPSTESFNRLINLSGSDAGFYILAIHSFIERFLKEKYSSFNPDASFAENMSYMQEDFGRNSSEYLPRLKQTFRHLRIEHGLTNSVRHYFKYLTVEEAKAATFNFIQFCELAGIENQALKFLEKSLDAWNDRRPKLEIVRELGAKGFESHMRKLEIQSLTVELDKWHSAKSLEATLRNKVEELNRELSVEKDKSRAKADKAEALREERGKLNRELSQLRKELSSYQDIESYLDLFKRLTSYTRTRMQYEQKILRLTTEQQTVLNQIHLNRDFLVKGGPGTGKTLVLLEALKRAQKRESDELGLDGPESYMLLTYTRTLAKYDQYIADIMEISDNMLRIQTVDKQLYQQLKKTDTRMSIDYQFNKSSLETFNSTDFLSDDLLYREIEDFLFGYRISEEEYLEQEIPRKGMRLPLNNKQRRQVWNIRIRLEEAMVQKGQLSRALAANLILRRLEIQKYPGEIDYIFVDESQDLPPIVLKVLKKLSRRAILMAGDVDQSIYRIGSPYKRAGIEIRGNTRILKTNFRNPVPIHRLAERFRRLSAAIPYDKETQPEAFRDGPRPEVYTSEKVEQLYAALIEKVKLFIEMVEYDPENICILAPTNNLLKSISDRLESAGFQSANIKNPDFDFARPKSIRLSPMHSSKGLDFPVVMLFVPFLPGDDSFSDDAQAALQRNLIYVSLTRAMDNLNVFMKPHPEEQPLKDLITAFAQIEEGGKQGTPKKPRQPRLSSAGEP